MTIKHENDEFLVITLKHVSFLKVVVNHPVTLKLWAMAHENGHKNAKTMSFWSYLSNMSGFF